jgi:hypothetical protein
VTRELHTGSGIEKGPVTFTQPVIVAALIGWRSGLFAAITTHSMEAGS